MGSPEAYKEKSIPIDVETNGIDRNELIKKLILLRYERNDIAFERGKFRVKGDIIDLHPSYLDTGYRFEFFGDDLESISEINTLTGQKIKTIKRVTIMPATHYLSTEDTEKIFSQIKKEMEERVHFFQKNGQLLEAQRIKRGLYQTSAGKLINADCNGALNVLRKSKVVDLSILYNRGELNTPKRIRVV